MQDKNSTIDARNFVVLKTMKPEHEVIHRNLERHRREAATMSHLTKSPYIADLYAYCGNSILTEFASQDLSRTLKRNTKDGQKERRRIIKDSNRAIREREPRKSIRQLSLNDNISDTSSSLSSSLSTTLALRTRIDWALQASKAIAYMHRSDVIHADITTKQFLVISSSLGTRKDGNDELNNNIQVKLNDFNRCRFVPRRQQSLGKMTAAERTNITYTQSTYGNTTGTCTVRIPSAPGSYRSPEEYSDKELTPQIDVFSLGHVLYEIWTGGQTPWNDVGVKRIKNMVMDGVLPIKLKKLKDWDDQSERHLTGNNTYDMNEDFLSAENERAFGRLITKCYAVDPKLRITADGLVRELTNLFESVRGQNNV
jgi:serine/threonine protein kinase